MSEVDLNQLVALCLQRMEQEGDAAVEAILREHPEHAPTLRRRIAMLRDVGLLGDGSTPPAGDTPRAMPERLGEFRLVKMLGGGGMGVVYLAEQEGLGREVALKIVRPEQLFFPGTRERFRREVETISRLQHPGIVPIHTVGEEGGIPYFTMERVHGCTLHAVLDHLADRQPRDLSGRDLAAAARACAPNPEAPTPHSESALGYVFAGSWEDACLRVVQQVAEALEHAHLRGVVHRDIKPSNIMLTPSGRAMLLDFGLASTDGTSRLTRTGSQLGSLHYMSPEQCRGDGAAIGPRTDVYALGVTLYELLTLHPAFAGDSVHKVSAQIEANRPTPVRRHNPAVTWEAETVCHRAMEADPERRYARATDLARDLGNVLEKRPIEARRAGTLRRARRWMQRNPTATVGLALAFLATVGGSIGYGLLERNARQRVEEKRARAERNFKRATNAVDTMLTRVSDERLRHIPQMVPVRRALLQEALETYREFLTDSQDDPDVRAETAVVHAKIADLHRELGEFAAAESAADKAIAMFSRLQRERPDEAPLRARLAAARRQRAAVLQEVGRARDANDELLAALDDLHATASTPAELTELAALHYELAVSLHTTDPTAAEDEYRTYIEIVARLVDDAPDTTAHRAMAARGKGMLAALLGSLGRWDEVGDLHRETIAIFERLAAEDPNERAHQRSLADALYNISTTLPPADVEAAETVCRRAEAIWIREVTDFPSVPEFRSKLAMVRTRLATLLARRGDLAAAIDALSANAKDLRRLVDQYPENIEFRFNLALGLQSLCNRQRAAKQPEAAIAAAEQGAELFEQLIAARPNDAEFRYHAGGILHAWAAALRELGDVEGACDLFVRAIGHQTSALRIAPQHERNRTYLRNHYFWLADSRIKLQQHHAAAAAAEQLIVIYPDSAAEWRRAADLIARCAWLPSTDSSLAADEREQCAATYDRRAVELLGGAIERGFNKVENLRNGATLARLRKLPEFAALLARLGDAK